MTGNVSISQQLKCTLRDVEVVQKYAILVKIFCASWNDFLSSKIGRPYFSADTEKAYARWCNLIQKITHNDEKNLTLTRQLTGTAVGRAGETLEGGGGGGRGTD